MVRSLHRSQILLCLSSSNRQQILVVGGAVDFAGEVAFEGASDGTAPGLIDSRG